MWTNGLHKVAKICSARRLQYKKCSRKPVPQVQNTEALQVQGKYYKLTRYSEVNPLLEVTMTEGYVQCALSNRASLVFLNTTDTKWNDGKAKINA